MIISVKSWLGIESDVNENLQRLLPIGQHIWQVLTVWRKKLLQIFWMKFCHLYKKQEVEGPKINQKWISSSFRDIAIWSFFLHLKYSFFLQFEVFFFYHLKFFFDIWSFLLFNIWSFFWHLKFSFFTSWSLPKECRRILVVLMYILLIYNDHI